MSVKSKIIVELVTSYFFPRQRKKRRRQVQKFAALALGGAATLIAARSVIRKFNEDDLAGKSVLITGGSRGLGLELAREFSRHGSRVTICARNAEELKSANIELLKQRYSVLALQCDVTDQKQVEALIEAVNEHAGRVDVLVNNAGLISVGPVEDMTIDDFEKAMQTNYFGSLYTILAVLPQMRARQEGNIINIASIGGKISVPHLVPYSTSKFALAGLSKGLHTELKKDGISVTTVYPGLMRTGSPRNATFKGQHRAEYAWFSISDSLPFVSMSSDQAAREIVSACKNRTGEIVLSMSAKIADKIHANFPESTTNLLSLVNWLLPKPGGIGKNSASGKKSESASSPSWLTKLNEDAAIKNNQVH